MLKARLLDEKKISDEKSVTKFVMIYLYRRIHERKKTEDR